MRLTLFISLLMLCFCVHADEKKTAADLKKLKQAIYAAQANIAKSEGTKNKLASALKETEVQLSSVEKKVYTLKKKINTQQSELKSLQQKEKQLELKRKVLEKEIIDQINLSYRLGREKKIKVILNQEDPAKLSRSLIYSDYINRANVESIEAFKRLLTEIESNKQGIETTTQALLADKNDLVAQQKTLKKRYQSRSTTLTKLNKSLNSDKKKLTKLKKDQKQLEALLQSVKTAIANIKLPSDSTPFAKTKGKLAWPAKGSRDYRFGKKRQPGNLTWEGISIYGKPGSEVTAIHHGRVVFADWFRGKGLLTIIDHGNGYMSLYAHNQALLRETGDWVSAGESIATLGDTGGIDHHELYFEIRHNGKPINPKYWFNRRAR
jgi:septal ring factor EnvC (AmiA/AmiB activator)